MARACAEESLALFDDVSDQWSRPFPVWLLGKIELAQGDVTQAAGYNEEFLTFYYQVGDKNGIALGLLDKGVIAQLQGEWEHAVALYAQSLALFREIASKNLIAEALHNLGSAVLHEGDARWAVVCFAEGLAVSREIGSRHRVAINLAGMAGVATAQAHPERSARLFGAADALFDAMGMTVGLVNRREYDRNREIARAQLGDEAFAAAWEAGRTLSLEQAIALALEVAAEAPPPVPAPPPAPQPVVAAAEYPASLTAREVEVLRLVAQGLTDAQVAERLILSAHTVHAHLRSIYGKLEVTSRAAATRFAVDHQLV